LLLKFPANLRDQVFQAGRIDHERWLVAQASLSLLDLVAILLFVTMHRERS